MKMMSPAEASQFLKDGGPAEASVLNREVRASAKPHPTVPQAPAEAAAADEASEKVEPWAEAPSELVMMGHQIDEAVATLAMSPWLRVASALRAQEEEKTIAGLAPLFAVIAPPFSLVAQRVWDGDRDHDALTAFLCEKLEKEQQLVAPALVQQLLACTTKLEEDVGMPDAQTPVPRRLLVKSIKKLGVVRQFMEQRKGDVSVKKESAGK